MTDKIMKMLPRVIIIATGLIVGVLVLVLIFWIIVAPLIEALRS